MPYAQSDIVGYIRINPPQGGFSIYFQNRSCVSSVCTFSFNYQIPDDNDWKFAGSYTTPRIEVKDNYSTVERNYYFLGDSAGDVTGTGSYTSVHSFTLPTITLTSGLPPP
jgi:hypothetical protein